MNSALNLFVRQIVQISRNEAMKHACNCWHDINSAPRDGTVVELRNTYGLAPWYGLFKWAGYGWEDVLQPSRAITSDDYVDWRPFTGDANNYVDPTNDAQESSDYWNQQAQRREWTKVFVGHVNDVKP